MTPETKTQTLLEKLRAETRPYHNGAEDIDRLKTLGSPTLTVDGYIDGLSRMYGFYAPMEAAINRFQDQLPEGLDWPGRQKAGWLAADLTALGCSVESIPQCSQLPALTTLAHVYGALYVMEGATLGGQLMYRSLSDHPIPEIHNNTRFYQGYGEDVGRRWQAFRQEMLRLSEDGTEETDTLVVDTACRTFDTFNRWMTGDQ